MKWIGQTFFRILFGPLFWGLYRPKRLGVREFPKSGGVLLLGNHVSFIDAFVVFLTCPRPVRFVILERYLSVRGISWFLRLFNAIPIDPKNARQALSRSVEALKAGDVVCLFPEGGLTRLGVTTEFKKGFEIIARRSGAPVVPFYMDGLWHSIFSFERGRYFKKWPKGLSCPLQVAFGEAIPAEEATTESIRQAVWVQSVRAFAARRDFKTGLEIATVRALKKKGGSPFVTEYGKRGPATWSRRQTLALSLALARRWMNSPSGPGERIGLFLPPGRMPMVINLGLVLAGKVPVNFPFSVDPVAMEDMARSMQGQGIRTIITAKVFMPHLIDRWDGEDTVFVDFKSLIAAPASVTMLVERLFAYVEPSWLTAWRLDLKARDPHREAVATLGFPCDAPVYVNAWEWHLNARQVVAAEFVRPSDRVGTELDLSLPEGLSLGLWAPLLGGGSVVLRSLTMKSDPKSLRQLLEQEVVDVLVAGANFYRQWTSPLDQGAATHGLVFEAISEEEEARWEASTGMPILRGSSGWGRVLTLSRPDAPGDEEKRIPAQRARLRGAIGRPLPGIAFKQDETGEGVWVLFPLSPQDTGEVKWRHFPLAGAVTSEGFVMSAPLLASKQQEPAKL